MDPNNQSQQQPQQQDSGGSWWQNILPTAGGILGGIGGAALGGAVDVGTLGLAAPLVNPFTMGVAGAGLGGAAGQAVKNATEGQNPFQMNDLSAAGENALGQATGEGLGLLGKGALGFLGKAADSGAFKLFKGQFDPASIAKAGLSDAHLGEIMGSGITDANQAGKAASYITGEGGALTNGVTRAVEDPSAMADLSGLHPTANNFLKTNSLLNDKDASDLSQRVLSDLKTVVPQDSITSAPIRRASGGFSNAPKTVDSIDPAALQNVRASDALQLSRNYRTLAQEAFNNSRDNVGRIINSSLDQKAKLYSQLAQKAEDAVYGGSPLTAENKAQIIAELEPLKSVNPDTYQYMVDTVNKSQGVDDLRSVQTPWVRASQALAGGAKKAMGDGGMSPKNLVQTGGGILGLLSSNPLEKAAGAAALVAEHPAAGKVGTSVLSRMGDILGSPTLNKVVQKGAAPLTVAAANVPGYSFGNNAQGGGMQQTSATSPAAGGSAVASPEAMQMMIGLLGLQADPYLASTFAPMVTNAVEPLQKAAAAQSQLPGLEALFSQAGGGQGGANGVLARLQSLFPGTAGNLYNSRAAQLQDTLQKLGLPGTTMPSLFSGAPAANAGFGGIQSGINALGGNPASVLAGVR